jgi:branched-chain amino acid transport system substrate-binding protein
MKTWIPRRRLRALLAPAVILAAAAPLLSLPEKTYDPGVSDTEIKIGNIMTYTGWASPYGAIGRAEAAYFQMINDRGGVNGRKINFLSLDSDSDASRALPLARKLVEEEHVFLLFGSLGTETNLNIRTYLNDLHVPQLFVDTSASVFNDPAHFPWTMGFDASFRSEGAAYAKYILQIKPDAKIAILYANDDSGRDYLAGVHDGLAAKTSAVIVKEASYSPSDTTIDAQIQALKASGADVLLDFAIGGFATQAIRKTYDLGWHPTQFIPNASLSVAAFLDPAGLEKSAGVITNARSKGWLRDYEQADPEVRDFLSWMHQYNPQASLRDQNNVAGYERAEALVELLKKCGNDLTRADIMRQASHLDLTVPMLRSGIKFRTTPTDFQPIHQFFLMQFDGAHWRSFGGIISD